MLVQSHPHGGPVFTAPTSLFKDDIIMRRACLPTGKGCLGGDLTAGGVGDFVTGSLVGTLGDLFWLIPHLRGFMMIRGIAHGMP